MNAAVLLMAYGGPDSLEDIPAYLLDVRHGRETPQALIDEITQRYRLIGGRSPLLPITRSAAAQLQAVLGLPVYIGMRHWRPFIREAVQQMVSDGVEHCTAIVMAPHYSRMSVGAYEHGLREALADERAGFTVDLVESWGLQSEYLSGVLANIVASWDRFAPAVRDRVRFVFTAHSLPAAILAQGDPYERQLKATAAALAAMLELEDTRWTFCYQSAPKADIPWLGPQVEDMIPALAQDGCGHVLVAPIGFVADHVEVLYDLDIALQQIARAHGVHLERSAMLNDQPVLIAALAALVRSRQADAHPEAAFLVGRGVSHVG